MSDTGRTPRSSRLIMACAGSANTGQMTYQLALTREGLGNLFCLAGIGAHIPGFVSSAKKADEILVLDGKALQKLAVVEPGMEIQTEADFRKALKGGKSMVIDFGSNSCIPCRQLRPVLQKVRKDYTGKLEVLIIEIQKNQQLAAEYQIQVMLTVVFIDQNGKEFFRHQGFMSEKKIKEQFSGWGWDEKETCKIPLDSIGHRHYIATW